MTNEMRYMLKKQCGALLKSNGMKPSTGRTGGEIVKDAMTRLGESARNERTVLAMNELLNLKNAEIEQLKEQIEQLKFAVEMAAPVMDAYCGVTRLNGFKSAAKRGGAL